MPNLECSHFVKSESSTWAVKFDRIWSLEFQLTELSNILASGHLKNNDGIGSDRIDKTKTGQDRINKTWIGLRPIDKTWTGSRHISRVTTHDQVLAKQKAQ